MEWNRRVRRDVVSRMNTDYSLAKSLRSTVVQTEGGGAIRIGSLR